MIDISSEDIDEDLARTARQVMGATFPEDLFGDLRDKDRLPNVVLEERYRALWDEADPDRFSSPVDAELARDLRAVIDRHYEVAQARFEAAAYGARPTPLPPRAASWIRFDGTRLALKRGDEVAEGTISTVYEGARATGDDMIGRLALKVADSPEHNVALWREKQTLETLHGVNGMQRAHLPPLLDHFRTADDRVGLVMRFLENCHDLRAVAESPHHRGGTSAKHAAWMLRRLLSVAGYAHRQGIVHGDIEPAHVFVRPEDHHLFLIDWCWSSTNPALSGDRFRRSTPGFGAPETQSREAVPTPAADLYSIGKCMVFVLGGNVETDEMPDAVEREFQTFVRSLTEKNLRRRAGDAWVKYHELREVVKRLWGKRKFLEFNI